MSDWAARKRTLEERVEELKTERGVALLDCQPLDMDELIRVQAELDILQAAEGEERRRTAIVAQTEYRASVEEVRGFLRERAQDRRTAIQALDLAAQAYAEALVEYLAANKDIRDGFGQFKRRPPADLMEMDAKRVAYWRLCRWVFPVVGAHFGGANIITIAPGDTRISSNMPDGTDGRMAWLEADDLKNNLMQRIDELEEAL